jgi:hypothetical protein
MKKTIISLLILLTTWNANAQLAMGKWRTHFAYNAINQVTQTENKIFALSDGSLFSIDKEADCVDNDGCMEYYSKMNGLNDAGIVRIDYDKYSKKLLIMYKNGNIDMMSSGGIINVPDLYNKPLSLKKTINHVTFTPDKAYLSCEFGIIVMNTKKNEVADTYYIGPNGSEVKILSTAILGGQLYALAQNAIYKANINEPNLVNFEYWSTFTSLPGSGDFKKISSFAGKLILHRGDKLYSFSTSTGWQDILTTISAQNVSFSDKKLIIYSSEQAMYFVDEALNTKLVENLGEVKDVTYDAENDTYFMAANSKGVISLSNTAGSSPKFYKPLGPAVNSPWSMTFAGEKLFVVPGGAWEKFYETPGNIMIFDEKKLGNDKWVNINNKKIEKYTNGIKCLDLVSVDVDPFDANHYFAISYSSGLYEFRDTTLVKWHNSSNSGIQELFNDKMYHMTDGLKFDAKGNLWLLNGLQSKSIKILKKDGAWASLDYTEVRGKSNMKSIIISNQNENQKWLNITRISQGLFIFDDNGTIDNIADDKKVFFSNFEDTDNEGGKISPGAFYCLAQDHNGVVWCGTDEGPLLFYNTAKVFDTDYTCSRVKIPRGDGTGLADYLLQSDKVKAIAIDGANRKWIGTENSGVYLMSENGQETLEHFTETNSPLLSNDILSIAINPITGEVFFGTSSGLVSYQGNAVDASETFTNVHAYPNPVRENYNGIITITGLVKDTQVKITDLNGNLICQTTSNGGIATWNGKNINGNKVSTGIYLVICANQDGTQSAITKIMVIN